MRVCACVCEIRSCLPPHAGLEMQGEISPPAASPHPPPCLGCLWEYRTNNLCLWPPASQKHLMSRWAQAALWGCVNLEEFPAWDWPLGGLPLPQPRGTSHPMEGAGSMATPLPLLC